MKNLKEQKEDCKTSYKAALKTDPTINYDYFWIGWLEAKYKDSVTVINNLTEQLKNWEL